MSLSIEKNVYLGKATPGTGGAPVIDELNVTPSTSAQTITAPEGTDGYSPVNVSAVTSSIDANIVAGNIKKDVEILGVTGSYEGVAPSGTKSITTNGIHDVAGYASADVQVPTTAPAYYVEKSVDADGNLANSGNSIINLSDVKRADEYVLYRAYYGATFPANTSIDLSSFNPGTIRCYNSFAYAFAYTTGLTNVDLSGLTTLGSISSATDNTFQFAFSHSSITSVDLSSLTRLISKNLFDRAFEYCTGLTSVNLGNLIQVGGNSLSSAFQYCTGITSIDLSSLAYLTGSGACQSMFFKCTGITNVVFSSLKRFLGDDALINAFAANPNMVSISFPAYRTSGGYLNIINNIISLVNGCTIHFPKNRSVSGLNGYPNFGGTNTILLFDLPSTVDLTGANNQVYERNPKYDTATALAWRKQDTGSSNYPTIDWTPFYTSTTNDPQVGDTIYSDAACTTAVTTISSIA